MELVVPAWGNRDSVANVVGLNPTLYPHREQWFSTQKPFLLLRCNAATVRLDHLHTKASRLTSRISWHSSSSIRLLVERIGLHSRPALLESSL